MRAPAAGYSVWRPVGLALRCIHSIMTRNRSPVRRNSADDTHRMIRGGGSSTNQSWIKIISPPLVGSMWCIRGACFTIRVRCGRHWTTCTARSRAEGYCSSRSIMIQERRVRAGAASNSSTMPYPALSGGPIRRSLPHHWNSKPFSARWLPGIPAAISGAGRTRTKEG